MIKEWSDFIASAAVRSSVAFLSDYDLHCLPPTWLKVWICGSTLRDDRGKHAAPAA